VCLSTNSEFTRLATERAKKQPFTLILLAALTLFICVLPNSYAATYIVKQPLTSVANYYSVAGSDPLLAVSLCEQQPVTQKDLLVPLLNNTNELGDIRVKIAMCPVQSNEIALLPLLNFISEYIDVALRAQLDKKSGSTPHITFRQLARHGIKLKFDPNDIALQVDFSAQVRKPNKYSLVSRVIENINDSQLQPNAKFSGGLDYGIGKTWSQGLTSTLTVDLDGHLNIKGWVVQNRQRFADNLAQKWRRQSTVITHDWPENTLRLRLRDLSHTTMGFMGSEQLSGISLSTNFALRPEELNYPISEQSFFLEEDAVVEVIVNSQRRDQRSLPAGAHNISDMGLSDGVNEVELKITDIYGRQQSILLSAFQNQTLLTPGKQEYSVTLGVPRSTGLSGLEYAYQSPGLSAFHRYGVTYALTLGSWLQLSANVMTAGMTGLRSSIYGDFSGEIAVSRDRQLSASYAPAVRIGHRFNNQRFKLDTQWSWQHREFTTLGQGMSDNNVHHKLSVRLTLPKIDQWRTTLTASHNRSWKGKNIFSKKLNVTRELGQDWEFSLNMTHYNSHADQQTFARIQLFWRPGGSRHSSDINYSSDNHKRSGNYNYRRVGDFGFKMNADISKSDSSQQQSASTGYASAYLDTSLRVDQSQTLNGQSSITKTAGLAASVVFADGHWATSRKLNDQSFAIVSVKSTVDNAKIGVVKGASMTPVASLDKPFDTVVLPNFSSYYVSNVYLDLSLAPAELQVKQESFKLKPTYLSATVMSIDVASGTYVTAKLTDSGGNPLGYKVVNVTTVNGTEQFTTFTDVSGLVVIEGLETGKYRISVPGQPIFTKLITIVDKRLVKVELGTLIMTQKDE
jgi:outer membrane usher protein